MDTSNMSDEQVEAEYARLEAEEARSKQTQQAPAEQTITTVHQDSPAVAGEPMSKEEQRGLLADMGVAAAHGVETAARQTAKTALDLGKSLLPPFIRDAVDPSSLISSETLTPKPETILGKIESDVIRFGLGFVGAGSVIKGAGLVAGAAKSAVSTFVTSDTQAERLSNLLEEHPYLANPVSEYLATSPDDSFAASKFKATIEDLGLSAVGGTLFKTFQTVKAMRHGTLPVEHAVTPQTVAAMKASETADAVGLKLTPEHTAKLAGTLDDILGRTYQGSEVAADAANPSLLNSTKMLTGDDVKATINRFGEVLGPIMKEQGWTESQTHVQTLAMAEELGLKPEVLMGTLKVMGQDAATMPQVVVAGRMLLQTQAADLFSTARRAVVTGQGKEEAIKKLSQVSQTLASLKMTVTGAARTTESGRIPVGEIDPEKLSKWITAQGGHDNVLQKLAMTEGNPTAIAKLARTLDDKVQDGLDTAWKYHNTIFINGLLSSPKTQVVNAVSTGVNLLAQPLNLMVGGTMRRDWNDVREGIAIYKGLASFLGDSWTMAKKAFATESPVLGGARIIEADAPMIEGSALWAQALRFPTRLLGTSDEFFKQLSYRSKVSAQAAREGMDAVKAGTIPQSELDGYIAKRFAEAFDKDGAALSKEALAWSEQATFTQSLDRPTWLGNWAEGVGALSSHPALRGSVAPFVRVPANLSRQVLDYTPIVGQLRKKFLTDMQAGGSTASEALGRATVGSALWVSAGMLALNDKITGAAPRDRELAAAKLATGWRPYSYVLDNADGTHSYISFNRLDPFASFLGLAADYAQISGHLPENKADEWAAIATLSIANNLMSKSYTKGIVDAMSALAGNDLNRAATFIRQRVASYVPSIVGVAQPDVELKELRTWLDGAMSKVPGLSSMLEPKRDIFGQKVQVQAGYPQSAFNPFPVSKGVADPVTKELARLAASDSQAQFSNPSEHLGNVNLAEIKNNKGQSAYDRWIELSGFGLREALNQRILSPSYQAGSDGSSWYSVGSRATMLREVIDRFRDKALMQVKREYPELSEALKADKANRLDVKVGREPRKAVRDILNFGK